MSFQSSVVVEALQQMAQRVHAHRAPLARVSAELGEHRFAPALEATEELQRALALVVSICRRLHANVVPADGLGPVESVGELVFRARRMVVVTQFTRLRDLLGGPDTDASIRAWFVGRFTAIDDPIAFVFDELPKQVNLVLRYRNAQAALYHSALRVAQRALSDLRDDPDLAYLLRSGYAAADWPEVANAFREIDAALAAHIDVEPSGPPDAPPPPIRI